MNITEIKTIRIKTEFGMQVLATNDLETARMLLAREEMDDCLVLENVRRKCGWYLVREAYGEPLVSEIDQYDVFDVLKKNGMFNPIKK